MSRRGSQLGACANAFLPRRRRDPGNHPWAIEKGAPAALLTSHKQEGVAISSCLDILYVYVCRTRRAELSVLVSQAGTVCVRPPRCEGSPSECAERQGERVLRLKDEKYLFCPPSLCPISLSLLILAFLRIASKMPRSLPASVTLFRLTGSA